MKNFLKPVEDFLLDSLFPRFCLSCQREGSYLCQDCESLLEINTNHKQYSENRNIKDLYFPLEYKNPIIKNIIRKFKYEPFVKELAKTLASLIISHLQLIEKYGAFGEFVLIPVPSSRKRLKWRGFNPSEEIAKTLAFFLEIPLIADCLFKVKETLPQIELEDQKRKENIRNVFGINQKYLMENKTDVAEGFCVDGKNIILVDDFFITGSTVKEAARVLKWAGAEEVVVFVVARG